MARPNRVSWRLAVGVGLLWLLPAAAAAHGDLDERITALDRRIAADPEQGALWLRRAGLHREHGDWDAALSDLSRASVRSVAPEVIRARRSEVLSEAGRCAEALAEVEAQEFDATPAFAGALTARAVCLARLGRVSEAAVAYERAIQARSVPVPELYDGRAEAWREAGDLGAAIASLDQGIAALGGSMALERRALALEVQAGRTDAALARLGRLAAGAARGEHWWLERGRILEEADRGSEALDAYRRALAESELRAAARRATPATRELEATARAALARLQPRVEEWSR